VHQFFQETNLEPNNAASGNDAMDVFSSRPLEGNSLAVFSDGRGLTDAEMQSLAKEMNLSETTFILPRDAATEREKGVRVRIFTVQEELPFAGHPTLGTAFALRGQGGAKQVVLELNVGKVSGAFRRLRWTTGVWRDDTDRPNFRNPARARSSRACTRIASQDFDDALPIQTVSLESHSPWRRLSRFR